MWKLVQSGLSVVAGTAEPEYGPDSIHPVNYDRKADDPLYLPLTLDDLKFVNPNHTNVETMVFYFEDSINAGFVQLIHSNIIGLHTTAQFTFKIFPKSNPTDFIWTSTKLENFKIENETDFIADDFSIVLNKENGIENINEYKIDSSVNKLTEVHLIVKKIGESIKFGKNGTTYYGTDIENPWGSMRHAFWPRCYSNGEIILRDLKEGQNLDELENDQIQYIEREKINLNNSLTMFVMALQGMKPHHAAATWDFLNYQSDNYSVVIMEFTTPQSYNKTKVSAAIVANKDGKILLATMNNDTKHLNCKIDETSGWNVPTKISYNMHNEDNSIKVEINGNLDNLCERVDVMAEIPQFVKNIVSGVAGTKPYVYQFSNNMNLKIIKNDKIDVDETGYGYNETTFITAI